MSNLSSSPRISLARRQGAALLERAAARIAPDAPVAQPAADEPPAPAPDQVHAEAQRIGDDWRDQPYYAEVEQYMDTAWSEMILPFLEGSDYTTVIDLAAGHGRNTRKLLEQAGRVLVTDINAENIAVCERRFAGDERVECFLGDGLTLEPVPDGHVTLVYCFDAMVHFDSDVVRSYLREFHRVLAPGGRAFVHHSNYTRNPGGDVHDNPQWRNFMSEALFAHYARKEGLRVLRSLVIDWPPDDALDCLTLLERP